MVNIDSLGMAAPQVATNLSSKRLVERVAQLAHGMSMPFNVVNIPGAQADSLPFINKGIPAVTISAIGNGWDEILHTRKDQAAKVNPTSVYLGYRLVLALVADLDNLACEISAEERKAR